MSSAVVFSTDTDDSGAGTDGTILNNAWKQAMATAINAALETSSLTSYSPSWTNSGTGNTLGNGTLSGEYQRIGKRVWFRLTFVWGSTTSSGSGNWLFSMPVTASGQYISMITRAFDTSAGQTYAGHGFNATSTTVNVMTLASPVAAYAAGTNPFTWATGDSLEIMGWYFV